MKMFITLKISSGEGVREAVPLGSVCCLFKIHSLYLTKGVVMTDSLKPTDELLPSISLEKRMAKWMFQ